MNIVPRLRFIQHDTIPLLFWARIMANLAQIPSETHVSQETTKNATPQNLMKLGTNTPHNVLLNLY